jgi:hypothetical protein
MPKGTKVHSLYDKLKGRMDKGSAVRIAQAKTGQSLMTGKKSKKK